MADMSDSEIKELRQLILKHKVCWDVWPVYSLDENGDTVQIGFELDLAGTVPDPENPPEPGSPESALVLEDLGKIARSIIPEVRDDCRSDILTFDNLIQYSPLRSYRTDYKVGIKILHRAAVNRPVDDCEVDCLAGIEEKLGKLGAQKGHWKKRRNGTPFAERD